MACRRACDRPHLRALPSTPPAAGGRWGSGGCADALRLLFPRAAPPALSLIARAGINPRWRMFRYTDTEGAVYRPHVDGSWPGSGLDAEGKRVTPVHPLRSRMSAGTSSPLAVGTATTCGATIGPGIPSLCTLPAGSRAGRRPSTSRTKRGSGCTRGECNLCAAQFCASLKATLQAYSMKGAP